MTKRIEYIDAMRGFTMLLVVYSHVLLFGYAEFFDDLTVGGERLLSFNNLFIMFRMPLFFFISGFILYKKDVIWNFEVCVSFLKKKAKIQLIPTFFFLWLYSYYIMDVPLIQSLLHPTKFGYWFTLALFEYFILYTLYRFLCYKLGKTNGIDWILLLVSICIYFAVTHSALERLGIYDSLLANVLGLVQLKYFLFFVVGTLIKKHFEGFQKLLDDGKLSAIGIFIFFIVTLFVFHNDFFKNPLYTHLFSIFSGMLGLILVFAYFRNYQFSFTEETRLGRILQYIGKRTLDIYLLHYFFLPRNLEPIGQFFSENVNPILEFIVSMFLSIVVVGICLLVSNIIRISPILGHWLFGVKLPAKVK